MKFRLTGKNFQSWKKFTLDVSGFTVIIGASNKGKSALVRSLRGVLRNQVSAAHIRKGEKTAEVSLTVGSGSTAVLTRNTKTTTYTVGEEEYAKLSGEIPPVLKDLNMHPITIGTVKLDPIFAGQFDSQFMLDLSPADLNAVFGLFSSTEPLNQGKKQINQSNTEINSQARLLAEEIQNSNVRVEKLSRITDEFNALKLGYDISLDRHANAQTTLTLLNSRGRVVERIGTYRKGTGLALPDTQNLQLWASSGRLIRRSQKLRGFVSSAKLLAAPIQQTKWQSLSSAWSLLHTYQQTKLIIGSAPSARKVSIDSLTELIRAVKSLEELQTLRTRVRSVPREIKNMSEELKTLHDSLHDLTKDSTECPKCGYQFTKE